MNYQDLMQRYGFIPMNHEQPNFFPVGLDAIYDAKGRKIPGHQAVVRGDTGDTLAVHSDKYALVPYSQHFEAFDMAIGQSSLDSTELMIGTDLADNGAKVFRQYLFPAHTLEIDTHERKRTLAMRIVTFDSYDGSTSFQGKAGFFDFVCANQSVFGKEMASFRFRHVGDRSKQIADAVEKLIGACETFTDEGPRLQHWPSIGLSAANFGMLTEVLPQANERLTNELVARYAREQGETLWDAHLVLSAWATHGIPAKTQADRQKRVAALVEHPAWRDLEDGG